MRSVVRRNVSKLRLPVFIVACGLVFLSCDIPPVWNADIKTFIEDGTSVVILDSVSAEVKGTTRTVIPSGIDAVILLKIENPRSLALTGTVAAEDDSLFESPPVSSVESPELISVTLRPSLRAERKDIKFSIGLSSISPSRSFEPFPISVHCNSHPGSVGTSLVSALDESGTAFAAFLLPSSPTDDDLSSLEITYAPVNGSASPRTVSFGRDDASLLGTIKAAGGKTIIGSDNPLGRYFRPKNISSGDDYTFTVVVIDTEGLRSETASVASNAPEYSITYDGNGDSVHPVPVDPSKYRQTKRATVLGPGSLGRAGYVFTGWNTAPDGTGTAYSPGDTLVMGTGNVTLYARWADEYQTVAFETGAGSAVSPRTVLYGSLLEVPVSPVRSGYEFSGWYRDASYTVAWDFPSDKVTATITLYARWISINSVTVTFSIANPTYGVITFSDPSPAVQWGNSITFSTSLTGGTLWHWYRNNIDTGVTSGTYTWDTSTAVPGQYIINVDAVYGGNPCSGSILVTVFD